MRISNPMFTQFADATVETSKATMKGVAIKTSLLLLISLVVAVGVMMVDLGNITYGMLVAASIIGSITVLIGRMNPGAAAICGVIYAVCEGLFLGALTYIVNLYVPGAGAIAVAATISIFVVMLVLYQTKIVQATPMLMKVLYTVGLSIMLFMLISFILNLFGVSGFMTMLAGNGTMAAVLAAVFIAYGSFMLVLNFDEAKTYIDNGFDKKYEWSAALGLIVTIIFIYVQVLRFILIIASNKD